MKLGKLKEDLLLRLAEQLRDHGFRLRKSYQHFRKKFPDGALSIHLAFVTHVSDFDVVVDVGIRFDRVEEVVHRATFSTLSSKIQKETCTLGGILHNISNRSVGRIPVSYELPIEDAVESILKEIETIAIPFLEAKSSREVALQYLIDSLPKNRESNFLDLKAAERACVFLSLEKRNSELSHLLSPEFGFVQTLNQQQAAALNALVEQLGELSDGWP